MSKKLEQLHGVFDKFWKYLYKSICSSQINDHRLYINLFVKMADILHIHICSLRMPTRFKAISKLSNNCHYDRLRHKQHAPTTIKNVCFSFFFLVFHSFQCKQKRCTYINQMHFTWSRIQFSKSEQSNIVE